MEDDYLAHFGVKGMKWGVRNAVKTSGLDRKSRRQEMKYAKRMGSIDSQISVYNSAVDKLNGDIDALNKKYKGKHVNMDSPNRNKTTDAYVKEYETMFKKRMTQAANAAGKSPNGTLKLAYTGNSTVGFEVVPSSAKHDDIEEPDQPMFFEFELSDDGLIARVKPPVPAPDDLTHDDFEDSEYLAHFGVKGMKWGVVKKQPANSNYSSQQRIRDRKIYGRKAENRINKRMNKGESIQSARHNEIGRRDKRVAAKTRTVRIAKQSARIVGNTALAVGGAVMVRKMMTSGYMPNNPYAKAIIAGSAVKIGYSIVNGLF